MSLIAALYVEQWGVYSNLPGVDVWDVERDARKYAGTGGVAFNDKYLIPNYRGIWHDTKQTGVFVLA